MSMLLYTGSLEELVDTAEVETAVKDAQDENLEQLAEELAPIIEQDTDLAVAGEESYAIELPQYESSSYVEQKTYYELANEEDGYVGATSTSFAEAYEREVITSAQEIAQNQREDNFVGKSYTLSDIDMREKHIKEQIKLTSPALWFVMYEGKIKFFC